MSRFFVRCRLDQSPGPLQCGGAGRRPGDRCRREPRCSGQPVLRAERPRLRCGRASPGHGTGNRIVPLGSSYIELVAVIDRDQARSSPHGSWVERRLVDVGDSPAALNCTRPDGARLDWRLAALDAALTEGLPSSSIGTSTTRTTRAASPSSTDAPRSASTGLSSVATRIDSDHDWGSMSFRFVTTTAHLGRTGSPSPLRTANRSSSADVLDQP